MKCKIFIDKEREEEVLIYAHEKTELVKAIEKLVAEEATELIGYKDREAVKLNLFDVNCFSVEDNRIYAFTQSEKLLVKCKERNAFSVSSPQKSLRLARYSPPTR